MVQKPLIKQGYSLAEEIANSVSHGIGLVFGIVGLVLLLVQAVDLNASATAITSYSLYGGSMILLFLASTLYHAIPHQRAKMCIINVSTQSLQRDSSIAVSFGTSKPLRAAKSM